MMIKKIMATVYVWFALTVTAFASPHQPVVYTTGVVDEVGTCRSHGAYCAVAVKVGSAMAYGWVEGPVVAGQTVTRRSTDANATHWNNPIRKQ